MDKTKEIEVIDLQQELAVFDPVTQAVQDAKERCANIILFYDTPDEIKEAKSFIYQLRKLKAPINEVHKLAKAEALKFTQALDGKKKELIGVVDEMIDEKYLPIKELEEKETQRLAEEALQKQREEEAAEAERQAKIDEQERQLIEKEAELLERQNELDRKERERQIAEDAKKQAAEDAKQAIIDADNAKKAAEDKAKQDAINAENARKQAAIDAENATAAAVQKAKDEATARANEKEAKIAEDRRAEEARILEKQAADEARIADKAHRSKIHKEIYKALFDMGQQTHQQLTQALIDGKIPHVTINY